MMIMNHENDNIKELFPDWKDLKPGAWSKFGKIIDCMDGPNARIEIGLYREPENNTEYPRHYTLQVFQGDEVVICSDLGETL